MGMIWSDNIYAEFYCFRIGQALRVYLNILWDQGDKELNNTQANYCIKQDEALNFWDKENYYV